MKRKTFWVVALVGLIAIGLAGTAFANEIAATVRNRFSCDTVPGELTTVTGIVTDHAWNGFTLTAGDTEYFVKTGPARIGRGLEEITDGTQATVEGYTGTGTNYRAEVAEGVNILRAKTITVGATTYDLSQVTVGGFGQGNCGACAGDGTSTQTQSRSGGFGGGRMGQRIR